MHFGFSLVLFGLAFIVRFFTHDFFFKSVWAVSFPLGIVKQVSCCCPVIVDLLEEHFSCLSCVAGAELGSPLFIFLIFFL